MQNSSAMIANASLKSLNNYVNQFTKPTSAAILSIKAPIGSAYGSEYILKTGFGGSIFWRIFPWSQCEEGERALMKIDQRLIEKL